MENAWESAKILIHRTEDGELEVNQSTVELLNSIQSPVQVVVVVGPWRSGKSYLLNRIIEKQLGKVNVFPVGNTVQAATKGITIWCCPHPLRQGHSLIFLDTEGLDDVEKGDREDDILIFILAVLLSSTLIYNSRGVIDFQALQTIHHVSYLAERIRLMPGDNEDAEDVGFDLAFPDFLWVVRDFQLKLEQSGRQITDDEYLENALSTSNIGDGPRESILHSIKRCLKEYFPSRKCFLLPNLHRMEVVSSAKAAAAAEVAAGDEGCNDKFTSLVEQVLSGKCKMHEGSEVTGRVFGKLAVELVAAEQRSQGPMNIPSIMNRIAEKENETAASKALALYRMLMTKETEEAVDEVTLHQRHFQSSEEATKTFMQSAVYPVENSFGMLLSHMKKEFENIRKSNSEKFRNFCEKTFKALRKEIIGESNRQYFVIGGFQKYREDMTKIRRRWEEIPILQSAMGQSFFMGKLRILKEEEADMIMNADRAMTSLKREEAAKREEEERRKLEELRREVEKKNEETVNNGRQEFEQKVERQMRSAIIRPEEAQISALKLRIEVLERELEGMQGRRSTEEAENCKHHIELYRSMLVGKQKEPSRWQKVSSSIRSFASGAIDSICRIFRSTDPNLVASCAAATVAAAVTVAAAAVSPQLSGVSSSLVSHAASIVLPAVTQVLSNKASRSTE